MTALLNSTRIAFGSATCRAVYQNGSNNFIASKAKFHSRPNLRSKPKTGHDVHQRRLSGFSAAPLTPFKDNGDLDLDKIPSYADHMEEFKVSSLFVTGTTGEGNSMTVSERKEVMKIWTECVENRFQTIQHIGSGNLRDAQELAEYAENIGADAIACVTPTYYKPRNEEDYVEYMQNVAAAAPNTPFYLYDINFMTGLYLDLAKFFEIGKDRIPTLAGIKHTSPSLSSMNNIHRIDDGRFHVMPGGDETYLEALSIGLDTSVIPSYSCPTLCRIKDAFEKGDLDRARMEQNRMLQVAEIRNKFSAGLVGVTKAITRTLGVDLGPPRLPLKPCTEAEVSQIQNELSQIGFFEWAKS